MKTVRSISAAALIAGVLLGASACSSPAPTDQPSATAAAEDAKKTPAEAAAAMKSFFSAATSDEIGAAFPDKATEDTFAPVLAKADTSSPAPLKKAVGDLALLKVSDPKAALAVAVDESQVKIDGQTATVPVSAVSVTSGGTKVANSDALAADFNNLVFRNGSWVIAFPAAASATASATASASAVPSPTDSAK